MRDLSPEDRALVDRFEAAGQGRVFRFLGDLDAARGAALLEQARGVDLELVERLAALAAEAPAAPPESMEPPEVFRPAEAGATAVREAREAGEELLARGAVAAVVVAGGQGTRLGFDGPKGAYPIGPVTDRTLFEWFAGRLLALRERYGSAIPLHVMTSGATHDATVAFFEERDHLGLGAENVTFFRQGMAPALDRDGRMLLAAPDRIFMAPNGHGGVFDALAASGLLDRMAEAGQEEIFYFQVDNVLVRIADPLFLGLHHRDDAEMSTKVVEKSGPDEKVGVVARVDGRLGVVEYSEMTEEQAAERGPDGRLRFGAGNIAIHAIRRDFAARVAEARSLPWHRAEKKVPHVDDAGNLVEPERPNAFKFERFVFDALPLAGRSVTLEVERAEEFSPVKNAEGIDSVATARRDLTELFLREYERQGLDLDTLRETGAEISLEIDPVSARDGLDVRLDAGEGGR